MTPLAALLFFTTEVIRFKSQITPTSRVFIGAQPGPMDEAGAFAWTKCAEPGVYIIQISEKTLLLPKEKISFAAAHEVCHVAIHRSLICTSHGDTPKMAEEANICATRILGSRR